MKTKIIITTLLLLSASASYAQTLTAVKQTTLKIANQSYTSSAALNAALNGATKAAERAGVSATSAAATAVRSNLVRSAIAGGATAGLVGLAAGVAVGALVDWSTGKLAANADGTVALTNKQAIYSTAGPFVSGMTVWTLANARAYTGVVESTSIGALLPLWLQAQQEGVNRATSPSFYLDSVDNCSVQGVQYYCAKRVYADGHIVTGNAYVGYQKNASKGCPSGNIYNGTACQADPSATLGEKTTTTTIGQVSSQLSTADKAQAVSSADLSNMTNAILQSLNQAGYQNAPMTTPADFAEANVNVEQALSPITQAQVNTAAVPTTATKAQPSSSTSTTTETETETDPNGNTTTTTTVNVNVDLGADPGTQVPVLEGTPTINNILDPIFNMMPRTFTISGPQGSCPNPTINVLGHAYNFDLMCSILNQQAAVISAIMIFAFTIAALRIVLSA